MLKITKKWPNFALGGQFWLQADFFWQVPPPIRLHPRQEPIGTKNFESPSIKNLEENPELFAHPKEGRTSLWLRPCFNIPWPVILILFLDLKIGLVKKHCKLSEKAENSIFLTVNLIQIWVKK